MENKTGKPWTTKDVESIEIYKAIGMTIQEMADELGRTRGAVAMFISNHKMSTPKRKWTEAEYKYIYDNLHKHHSVIEKELKIRPSQFYMARYRAVEKYGKPQ